MFRLTPTVLVMIIFSIVFLPKIGSGPRWDSVSSLTVKNCRTNWWSVLLYVQNFVDPKAMVSSYLVKTQRPQRISTQCTNPTILVFRTLVVPRCGHAAVLDFTDHSLSTVQDAQTRFGNTRVVLRGFDCRARCDYWIQSVPHCILHASSQVSIRQIMSFLLDSREVVKIIIIVRFQHRFNRGYVYRNLHQAVLSSRALASRDLPGL